MRPNHHYNNNKTISPGTFHVIVTDIFPSISLYDKEFDTYLILLLSFLLFPVSGIPKIVNGINFPRKKYFFAFFFSIVDVPLTHFCFNVYVDCFSHHQQHFNDR